MLSRKNQRMIHAALTGDKAELIAAIEAGATTQDMNEALRAAASRGHVDIINYLIEHGAMVDGTTPNNHNTPLMLAVEYNQVEAVRVLLNAGANPNPIDDYGDTALLQATRKTTRIAGNNGSIEIAKLLIEKNADTHAVSRSSKTTPLMYAMRSNDIELIRLLLNKGADINEKNLHGETPLMYAAAWVDTPVFTFLLRHDPDVTTQTWRGKTALDYATKENKAELVQALLTHRGRTRVTSEDKERCRQLAKRKKDPTTIAVFKHHYQQERALFKAIEEDNLVAVKRLIDEGVDTNSTTSDGNTPLIVAIIKDTSPFIIQLLVERGANINATNTNGETALMIATKFQDLNALNFLLSKGASPDIADNNGNTPLLRAARAKDEESLIALYAAGAKLDLPALKKEEVITQALSISAFIQAIIENNITPLFSAKLTHDEFNRLLEQMNTKTNNLVDHKAARKTLRKEIKIWIQITADALDKAKESAEVEEIQFRTKAFIDRLAIIQKTERHKGEKKTKQMLLNLVPEIEKKLALLREKENPNTILAELKKWLDKKPRDIDIDNMIADSLLEPLTKTKAEALRKALHTLNTDQQKKLKQLLFNYIKKMASQYKMEKAPRDEATPMLTIDHLQKNYVDYKESRDKDVRRPALFEIFRMHHSGEVNRDTGTWRAFMAIMEDGKFKRTAPAKVSALGFLSTTRKLQPKKTQDLELHTLAPGKKPAPPNKKNRT